jgi:hypothetical protein
MNPDRRISHGRHRIHERNFNENLLPLIVYSKSSRVVLCILNAGQLIAMIILAFSPSPLD